MLDSYFFRVLVAPAAVFLSVVFGASYGSGREVMEFVSRNGPSGGLVSIATLFLVYSFLLVLSFELARMYRSYEYVSFFKVLLGKAWFFLRNHHFFWLDYRAFNYEHGWRNGA